MYDWFSQFIEVHVLRKIVHTVLISHNVSPKGVLTPLTNSNICIQFVLGKHQILYKTCTPFSLDRVKLICPDFHYSILSTLKPRYGRHSHGFFNTDITIWISKQQHISRALGQVMFEGLSVQRNPQQEEKPHISKPTNFSDKQPPRNTATVTQLKSNTRPDVCLRYTVTFLLTFNTINQLIYRKLLWENILYLESYFFFLKLSVTGREII